MIEIEIRPVWRFRGKTEKVPYVAGIDQNGWHGPPSIERMRGSVRWISGSCTLS